MAFLLISNTSIMLLISNIFAITLVPSLPILLWERLRTLILEANPSLVGSSASESKSASCF